MVGSTTVLTRQLISKNNRARTLLDGREKNKKSQPNSRLTRTPTTELSKLMEISSSGASDFENNIFYDFGGWRLDYYLRLSLL